MVNGLITASGYWFKAYRYDNLGSLSKAWNNGNVPAGFGEVYGYTGREQDWWTGLQYNRNRYYDSQSALWISQAPLGFGGGDVNLYRYVGGQSVNYTDPTGEIAFIPFLVWGAKVGLAYLATQATVSAVETVVEAGVTRAWGGEQAYREFNWGKKGVRTLSP